MRFLYLKIALLVGALAANAHGGSARLLVHSSTSDRDAAPAPRAIKTEKPANVSDEERGGTRSYNYFLTKIMKFSTSTIHRLDKETCKVLNQQIMKRVPVSQVFKEQNVGAVMGNLLTNESWLRWAYFVYSLDTPSQFYAAISSAMVNEYGFEASVSKLVDAVSNSKTKEIAERLMKELFYHKDAKKISPFALFKLLKLDKKMDNFFESWSLKVWSEFVHKYAGKQYTHDSSSTEVTVFKENYGVAVSLKKLTSPDNADNGTNQRYLNRLRTVWLENKNPPSEIVSMLALDKAHDHLFLDLQTNKLSVYFWKNYLTQFNFENPTYSETMMQSLTNAVGFARAWTMMRAAMNVEDEETSSFAFGVLKDQFAKWKKMNANTPANVRDLLCGELKARQVVLDDESINAIDGICVEYLKFYLNI